MMRRRILRIGHTAVYVHLATGLFALYWICLGQWKLLVISMLSILLHEAAHGAVSAWWGYPPAEIEITPMGALMRLEDEAALPVGKRFCVLLAGPAMSLMLCWAAIGLTKLGLLSADTGRLLFSCNLLLLLLNMLPALPLDGGRMLCLLLGLRWKGETVKRVMQISGTVLGVGFIALNLWTTLQHGGWNLSMTIVGCFLIYAAAAGTTSAALAELRMLMDRKIRFEQRGSASCQWVAVYAALPLRQAVERLAPGRYTMFLLIEPGTMAVLRQTGETDVISAYLNDPSQSCKVLMQ